VSGDAALPALDSPVAALPGIGPARAASLENLGIGTVGDLLFHIPRSYQDRRHFTPLADLVIGEEATVRGVVASSRHIRMRGRMSMAVVRLEDESGAASATFFGRGFLAQSTFKQGVEVILTGMVEEYKGPSLKNPEYEVLSGEEDDCLHTGCIVPVYPLTDKVSQRMLRRWIRDAMEALSDGLEESLDAEVLAEHGWPGMEDAVRHVHYPPTLEAGEIARERFIYEELLGLQLAILGERAARVAEERGHQHTINGPVLKALGRALPFALTDAQERAVSEILADMASPRAMARLVQGDVGCGKTVVALHAVAAAADGGFQTAIMAPTEILAEQHTLHMRDLLEPIGCRVELLTGSMRNAADVRKRVAAGEVDVVVGTQALFQEKTVFSRLGLVVIDEQHRFGVMQRSKLTAKGHRPDVLHMTATPIPRTLAITVYGGMDCTLIDELPPGRRTVITRRIPAGKVPGLYDYLVKQAQSRFQSYVICPLVDESETRDDLTPVIRHFEELSQGPLREIRAELIHGRLDAAEKEDVMRRFKVGDIDVLFSTTVIEVGIDVPTATTMVVEDAPQFGLTQLHQLRGRVGRGTEQSHCFLLGTPKTEDGKRRLQILCEHSSGFDIAEQDLLLRGPGEFYGVRQAGLSDLRIADLIRDVRLLDRARRDAQALLNADPAAAENWKGLQLPAAAGLL
jgi:ATP-dependent DNA helicase RecG